MKHAPSGGAVRGTATEDSGPLSIGAVLHVLREEFPDVTVSKIRFLETEGLVEPGRSPSGYRKFSPEDVERLGCVLRLQRDHYLPLKVIRDHLDALARGERPPLPGPRRDPLDPDPAAAPPAARVDRAQLLTAADVTEDELAAWEAYGLLSPGEDGSYDGEDVTVARLMGDLARFGLEPRHLRAVKASADREADLVEQVVAPLRRHRSPRTRARAESTAAEMTGLSVQLHAALLRSALRLRTG
ncbi:MerR family transcriptional regulator [Streptomyces sp. HNM0574]|uniref:transcriptional regulator FtsR n=1 Tax=Streptomyces sp. HNM0574 TaxID=2714954 RepID=UPI00146EDCCC|nr:MerR family transcriptional regulator [Streptomyces sp. HNM0574]NLU69958.1 MerR family transcriptional regulator [Streptomyces sp. HNM0574]